MATLDRIHEEQERRDAEKKRSAVIFKALISGRLLDNAEEELRKASEDFDTRIEKVEKETGLGLYQRSPHKAPYFWMKKMKPANRHSIDYPSRFDALDALLNNAIKWKD